MTEFNNLSEKRVESFDGSDMDGQRYSYHYPEEDVKEFIRLCEDNSEEINGKSYIQVSKMQKFAGEKLTK